MGWDAVVVVAGLLIAAYAVWERRKMVQARQARAPAPPEPAIHGDVLAPASKDEEFRRALYRHAEEIEKFVEKSSHPRELLDDPDFRQAAILMGAPDVAPEMLRQYAAGAGWQLACVALSVLAARPDPELKPDTLIARLPQMRPWPIYFLLRYCAASPERPPTGAPVAMAQRWWRDNPIIPDMFDEYLELRHKLGDAASFGAVLDGPNRGDPEQIGALLDRLVHPGAALLRQELRAWQANRIDRKFLLSVGRFWEAGKEEGLLVVPDAWRDPLTAAAAAILKAPRRSVLVAGETRVGKTGFLKLMGQLLMAEGWTVFEASGTELMAGQVYIGQLEERIRSLIQQLEVHKKLAWYIPDLLQLAQSGRHQGQSASMLDQLFGAVSDGSLMILSETSPAGLVRLLQQRPSLRSAMEICRLQAMSEVQTGILVRQVAARIADAAALTVSEEAIDSILHLSHQYLGSSQLPGITLDLLKRAANHAISADRDKVTAEDALETLSQLSGLPRTVLDDDQRLDLAAVRQEFAARVIGQDEAVNAIIDRIAMLKAGLIDPRRPIGVFLFAGPTGTGKTELAKTLAAYMFGSAERMTRLDMSELQTAESTVKILGTGGADSDSLAEKVRRQPFSVVLLDEFEKAHPNVWDLFLQVFDDGRLTDANGRLVDFHHAIIILTTNLGATAHQSSVVGFGRGKAGYSPDQIMQAVGRTFRPEFVNRLDKIIVFRPLSRAFMRQILEKELSLVLERRGLRHREWAVEWEDSAIGFLLDRGFSPDMGARPLRRAVDEYLLAPLAATMVEHRYPAGDQFLFVRSDGNAIQVEFVDPDAKDETAQIALGDEEAGLSVARAILNPRGDAAERDWLQQDWTRLARRLASPEWTLLKDGLLAQSNAPDIWQRADRGAIFSRIELMERVGEAARTAERLGARLEPSRGEGASRELAARFALQLHLIGLGIEDAMQAAPVDALLSVEALLESEAGDPAAWRERIEGMYRGWAVLRRMKLLEVPAPDGKSPPVLQVTGFGAWHTLRGEAGLHVLESGEGGARQACRVRVAPGPPNAWPGRDLHGAMTALLADSGDISAIVRRYRDGPAALVRDARSGWRSGKLDAVLAGNFDLIAILKSV